MALQQELFAAGPEGATLSASNTSATVTSIPTGGSAKFAGEMAGNGSPFGGRFESVDNKQCLQRYAVTPAANRVTMSLVLTLPPALPTTNPLQVFRFRGSTVTGIVSLYVYPDGSLRIIDAGNKSTTFATAAVLSAAGIGLSSKIRVEWDVTSGSTTAGKVAISVYTFGGNSPVASVALTNANTSTEQITSYDVGVISSSNTATVVGVADLQTDGGGTGIPGPPTASGSVAAKPAAGTGQAVAPTVTNDQVAAGGGPAMATADAPAPAVTGSVTSSSAVTMSPPAARATADALAPTVTGGTRNDVPASAGELPTAPIPATPPVVVRQPTSITWHSFDLRTGRRGQQLVTAAQYAPGRTIGEPTDLTGVAVRCYDPARETSTDGTPTAAGVIPGWDAATLPGRSGIVALNEVEQPVWAGMILRRSSDPSAWVTVDSSTLEAYFDRRYTSDHTFTATAQGAIVEAIIVGDAIPTGIRLTVDAQSATPRDRVYADDEDKTVLAVLTDLMAVEGGPEFTVDVEWADDSRTVLNPIVRVRDRVGTAAAQPLIRFELPGSVSTFTFLEDFTLEYGADDVMATSSGEGDVRPKSDRQVATDLLANGWPRYERRFEPSTSITNKATLNAHARSELAQTRDGLSQLTLEVELDTGPRVGTDFHLGDDVTAVLTCPRFPLQAGPDGGLVPGYSRTVRCIGYEVDYDARRLKPKLLDVG